MAKCELAQRLQSDVVAAMKAKDKEKLGILRMVQAAVKQVEVDERRELTDEDVTKIISSYARKVKDQIKSYGEGGRADLLAEVKKELEIVSAYLPEEMSDQELEKIVKETIAEVGAAGPQDMGKVMKAVMPKTAGRADGSKVSGLVKKALLG
ncbi:glutamyl-tRNA amidotransferase [bacterium DOLJORAL78_65_58]|nr:MAG: glutamyl-tRNA amidotransferase [bacterium DOLZORAL124_64_63]PIE75719.1 MAG: glutamyl-tRNA amidotransferase [bacterium DOLJORAL78_65_58]